MIVKNLRGFVTTVLSVILVFFILPVFPGHSATLSEREALIVLYNSTNGANWTHNS